jgi:hypothetical protein
MSLAFSLETSMPRMSRDASSEPKLLAVEI